MRTRPIQLVRDGELQDSRQRHAHQTHKHAEIHAKLPRQDVNALGPA
jgi:hypothetical protein